MPKAQEVANELRKLVEALEKMPDAEIKRPYLLLSSYDAPTFRAAAKIMPKPFKKDVAYADSDNPELRMIYGNPTIHIQASVPQKLVCKVIEPAKPAVYDCAPVLSEAEDAEFAAGTEVA